MYVHVQRELSLPLDAFYASVRMCSEAYGSHFVCVFVPRVSVIFRGLWSKVSVSTDIISCFLHEIWQYLLTSKALVIPYNSSK